MTPPHDTTPESKSTASSARQRAATIFLILILAFQILGAIELNSLGYSGLILRHDRVIGRVRPGSPGEFAGFHAGDVLVSMSGPSSPPTAGDHRTVIIARGDSTLTLPLKYTTLPLDEKAWQISFSVLALASLILGYSAYVGLRGPLALVFALLCLDFALLTTTKCTSLVTSFPLLSKTVYDALVLLFPILLLHFLYLLLQRARVGKPVPLLVFLLYALIPPSLVYATYLNTQLLSGEPPSTAVYAFEAAAVLYYLGVTVLACVLFINGYRKARNQNTRRRLRTILWGSVLGILPLATVTTLMNFKPGMEIPFERFVPLTLIMIPVSFSHAVAPRGLRDVIVLLRRAASDTIPAFTVVALFTLIHLLMTRLLQPTLSYVSPTIIMVVALLITLAAYAPIRQLSWRLVDRRAIDRRVQVSEESSRIYHSCFISYSHTDIVFAEKVYDLLLARGITCWLDEKEILPGERIHDVVSRAIGAHDKLLLCCSEASLNSSWVADEIAAAVECERKEARDILIPLNLDDYLFREWRGGHGPRIRERLAADFRGWENDEGKFEGQCERIINALRVGRTMADPQVGC